MTAIIRSLVIWAGILFWVVLYVLAGPTVVAQAFLVLAAVLGMAYVAASEIAPDEGSPQWRDE